MRGSGRLLGALVGIVIIIVVFAITSAVSGTNSPPNDFANTGDLTNSGDLANTGSGSNATSASMCPAATLPMDAVAYHLASLFLPAPAGFTQAPDTQSPNGPITLQAYSQSGQNPPLLQNRLQSDGFLGGYRRVWDNASTGLELHIVMYQFTCPLGAQDDLQTNGPDESLISPQNLSVPGIPGALAAAGGPGKNGSYEKYVFATSRSIEMKVYLFGAQPPDAQALISFAQQQFQLLGQSS